MITNEFCEHDLMNEVIEKINKNNIPAYIYGCGNAGQALAKQLNAENIKGFIVSGDNYIQYKSTQVFNKYKVFSASEMINNIEDVYLLVSIAPTDELKHIVEQMSHIAAIYWLDGQQLLFPKMTFNYVCNNVDKLDLLESKCLDSYSKDLMKAYINTRISGDLNYICEYTRHPRREIYFDRNILMNKKNEVLIDCGAYIGDSIKDFIKYTNGDYDAVYSFEPNEKNFESLEKIKNQYDNIFLFKKGCGNKKETLHFNSERGPMSSIESNSDEIIEIDTIDDCLRGKRVTFIKMNIEGSEYNAIEGASNTIKKCKPRCAISVYHKPEDLFIIPSLLLSLNPDYRFYLRLYSYGSGLLVLYAV